MEPILFDLQDISPAHRDAVGDRALSWHRLQRLSNSMISPAIQLLSGQVLHAEIFKQCRSAGPESRETWRWIDQLNLLTPQIQLSVSVAWPDSAQSVSLEEILPEQVCDRTPAAIQTAVQALWRQLHSPQWRLIWEGLQGSSPPIALILQPIEGRSQATGWVTPYPSLKEAGCDLLQPSQLSQRWLFRGDPLSLEHQQHLIQWIEQVHQASGDSLSLPLSVQWQLDALNQLTIRTGIAGDPLLCAPTPRRFASCMLPEASAINAPLKRLQGIAQVIDPSTSVLSIPMLPPGTIAVMKELDPDWMPALQQVTGIIVEQAGRNTHGAILARELGIPLMLGIEHATQDIQTGDRLMMDASEAGLESFDLGSSPGIVSPGIVSKHDRKLPLRVNLSQPAGLAQVLPLIEQGRLEGLGLVRSEWLLLPTPTPEPSWTDQLRSRLLPFMQALNQLASSRNPRVSSEHLQFYYRCLSPEANQSRLDPFHAELLVLDALQQQMPAQKIHLILPFVRMVDDLVAHRAILDHFLQSRETTNPMELWMMAEVPAVVYFLDDFIDAGVEGIVIGLNDLTALTLGIDRTTPLFYQSMEQPHRSVVHAVEQLAQTCRRRQVPCWLALSCWSEAWVNLATSIGVTGLMVERGDWVKVERSLQQ